MHAKHLFIGCALAAQLVAPLHAQELTPRRLPNKPSGAVVRPLSIPRTVIVKLADDAGARAEAGQLRHPVGNARLERVSRVLEQLDGATLSPLFDLEPAELETMRRRGEQRIGAALADLSQYFRLVLSDDAQVVRALELLNALDAVEIAYTPAALKSSGDFAPTTPALVGNQGYRAASPSGVDASAAKLAGFEGAGVTIVDIEFGWNLNHEDLQGLASQGVPPALNGGWATDPVDPTHPTKTIGVLRADDDTPGMIGIANDAVLLVNGMQSTSALVAPLIASSVQALEVGDLILIELETSSGEPAEIMPDTFDAIRNATALGVHVIEAAGNGALSLDVLDFCGLPPTPGCVPPVVTPFLMAVQDSGAIFVGAGNSTVTSLPLMTGVPAHQPRSTSNFGERVCAYSWGDSVASLGGGDLLNQGVNQTYTATFNGTSSASAIVAGAATVLAARHEGLYGRAYAPAALRALLRTSGTWSVASNPQFFQPTPLIGRQPDLALQLARVETGPELGHFITGHFLGGCAGNPFGGVNCLLQGGVSFGATVAGAGDVDGDGMEDLLVCAPTHGLQEGSAQVHSGRTGRILHHYPIEGSLFVDVGRNVAAGDFDGDGLSDIAVGAPASSQTGSGEVRIAFSANYSYTGGLTLPAYDVTLNGALGFGHTLAAADLDNDGFSELLIGEVNSFGTQAYVWSMALGTTVPIVWTDATTGGLAAGNALAVVGDWDNDGFVDIAAGDAAGEVRVMRYDPTLSTWPLVALAQDTASSEFGAAVAPAGDVNGDGFDDLIVGAPNGTGSVSASGQAIVFHGHSGIIALESADLVLDGTQSGSRFGASVAGAQDIDRDERPDLLVGAPLFDGPSMLDSGQAHAFSGRTGALLQTYSATQDGEQMGASVALLADMNADQRAELLIGSPLFDVINGAQFVSDAGAASLYFGNGPAGVSMGCAKAGTGGLFPNLVLAESADPCVPGTLVMTNALPNAAVTMIVSNVAGTANLVGTCLVPGTGPGFLVLSAGSTSGTGTWSLPIPYMGVNSEMFVQLFVADPGATFGASASNGLKLLLLQNPHCP